MAAPSTTSTPAGSADDPLARPFFLAGCVELAYADCYAAAACGDPAPLPGPSARFHRSLAMQLLTGILHLAALEQLTLDQVAAWLDADDLSEATYLIRRHYPSRPPQVLRWIPQVGDDGGTLFAMLRTAVGHLVAGSSPRSERQY